MFCFSGNVDLGKLEDITWNKVGDEYVAIMSSTMPDLAYIEYSASAGATDGTITIPKPTNLKTATINITRETIGVLIAIQPYGSP